MTPARRIIGLLGLTLALTGATNLSAADKSAGPALTKDWPNWRGPTCSGLAAPCGEPLVEDLSRARLLWECAEDIPSNLWSGGRHGSYDSVIVADGKVFIGYQHGPHVDGKYFGGNWESERKFPIEDVVVDYVILCLDAKDGKTLWKTVLDQGPNMVYRGKRPGMHNSPCYWQGHVYAQSNLGRVYCLDAKTGQVKWQVDSHKTADQLKVVDAYRRHGNMHPPGPVVQTFKLEEGVPNPFSFGHPVMVAGGTVIAAAAPLIDAETGKVLAEGLLDGKGKVLGGSDGDHSAPLRWTVDGKEYVIKGGGCYDPRTGKQIWTVSGTTGGPFPTLGDGHIVYSVFKRGLFCYAITPAGAELKWHKEGLTIGEGAAGVIKDGWLYAAVSGPKPKVGEQLTAIELATGRQVGPLPPLGIGKSAFVSAAGTDDKIVFGVQHGERFGMNLGTMDPEDLKTFPGFISRKAGDLAHASSPAIVDGRLYLRTSSAVKCWDLRESNSLKPGETNPDSKKSAGEDEPE